MTPYQQLCAHMEWADALMWKSVLASPLAPTSLDLRERIHHIHMVQHAYLQIWRNAGEFNPGHSTPLAWMVAIARRLAIDAARRPQLDGGNDDPEVIDENEGPGTVGYTLYHN